MRVFVGASVGYGESATGTFIGLLGGGPGVDMPHVAGLRVITRAGSQLDLRFDDITGLETLSTFALLRC